MAVVRTSSETGVPPPPFETALFILSDCLAEAHCAQEWGDLHRARVLYRLAERYALHTGYLELLRLAWTYADTAAASCPALTAPGSA
jgi:hypothetical protein